ncbi:MAG: hypothetical protein EBQ92_07875 [Proteobacteria bacterium]|nr:hypothetical protein [Pseudomonadota bacterium]
MGFKGQFRERPNPGSRQTLKSYERHLTARVFVFLKFPCEKPDSLVPLPVRAIKKIVNPRRGAF